MYQRAPSFDQPKKRRHLSLLACCIRVRTDAVAVYIYLCRRCMACYSFWWGLAILCYYSTVSMNQRLLENYTMTETKEAAYYAGGGNGTVGNKNGAGAWTGVEEKAILQEGRDDTHATSGAFVNGGKAAVPSFATLFADSLKATSVEHGMQYSSIYWETGHRTYLPFWASLTQKFSWKIIDDQLRSLLRLPRAVTEEPFVFASAQPYIRQYYGDADISLTFPLKMASRFAFLPTGTVRPWEEEKLLRELGVQAAIRRGTAATTFRAVLESAWKCDMEDTLDMYYSTQQKQQQQQR